MTTKTPISTATALIFFFSPAVANFDGGRLKLQARRQTSKTAEKSMLARIFTSCYTLTCDYKLTQTQATDERALSIDVQPHYVTLARLTPEPNVFNMLYYCQCTTRQYISIWSNCDSLLNLRFLQHPQQIYRGWKNHRYWQMATIRRQRIWTTCNSCRWTIIRALWWALDCHRTEFLDQIVSYWKDNQEWQIWMR